jgi:YVTN family beta-propeller protein
MLKFQIFLARNNGSNSVSVINIATSAVIATILTPPSPFGISISPDGSRVYVASSGSNSVLVIDTGTNMVTGTIPVGTNPVAFGTFIQPLPNFAGTPLAKDCHGKSVSALATKYGGFNAAAAAFGFAKVQGMQDAIRKFCGN